MHASRRLSARAHAVSKDRMEKDKEQQRLQFNSAVENDDERRRPECSNGKISGEEIEDLDPGSCCGDRSQTGEVFKDVLSQSEYFKNQAEKTMSKNVLITIVTKPGSVFLIPEIVERSAPLRKKSQRRRRCCFCAVARRAGDLLESVQRWWDIQR